MRIVIVDSEETSREVIKQAMQVGGAAGDDAQSPGRAQCRQPMARVS